MRNFHNIEKCHNQNKAQYVGYSSRGRLFYITGRSGGWKANVKTYKEGLESFIITGSIQELSDKLFSID
jgi:hypothetical protein